jgi:hypothetical protein
LLEIVTRVSQPTLLRRSTLNMTALTRQLTPPETQDGY